MSYNHKKKSQKQAFLAHLPARDSNPEEHTNQEAYDAPLVDVQGLNPGPLLMTPEGAPLGQWV